MFKMTKTKKRRTLEKKIFNWILLTFAVTFVGGSFLTCMGVL